MPIRTLQTRILAFFLLLMVVVQVGAFVLINTVGGAAARKTIGEELVAGARVFGRLLEQDTQRLIQGARLLSSDYAFRESIATGASETIVSMLANHGKRIDADVMMIIGLDQRVVADTLGVSTGQMFAFPRLLAEAESEQHAAAMVLIRGQLYQLVIVPVLAPLPIAWVAVGSSVNDALARDLQTLMRLQVSFLSRQNGDSWRLQASTLAENERVTLLNNAAADRFAGTDGQGNAAYGDDAVTRVLPLSARANEIVVAVLQQPLAAALEPFHQLQRALALISLLAVVVSIIASALIARSIARPVRELAGVARQIAAGDYSTLPPAPQQDEIGDLSAAFRTMQEGLATREARIMDLAYRDTLTGLANRALYADRLGHALAATARSGTPLAVLLMDIDHFKYVNDTLGHPIGDLLLCEVASRLQSAVKRKTDTVARLGGDEFAILLPGNGAGEAQEVAKVMLRALEAPMILDGHLVDVRASIGVAVCPEHGSEPSMLMRHADVAMYAAKRNNVGVAVWDHHYDQHSGERLSLMSDLRQAVDANELMLVYQPKIAFGSGSDHHVEALVRWRHPTRGLVSPAEFIPFAEQTGYIRAITQWVLARAIAQCATWRSDGLPMNVSINISARDLMDVELPDRFATLLQQHDCSAHWIALEITESAILDDPARAIENLDRLHGLGCKLAIDDYGTGYSSLAYLRRLPVHELKIDKSFVMGMGCNSSDFIIVRSTIDLAHNMGLAVVAEGVEDEATLERLRALGCDMVQGFLLSRPLGATEIATWMRGSAGRWSTSGVAGLRHVV